MGIIRDTFGDTIANSSGCAILFVCFLPIMCVKTVIDSRREKHQAAIERVADAKECRAARLLTDSDITARCENVAAMFGHDATDPEKLGDCLEAHQSKIRQCDKDGM